VSRLVVVTGGGRGIGHAIVERFRAADERVLSVGRGGSAVDEVCDVTDEGAVVALFERIGAVDVLVCNAGIAESETLARTTLEQWRRHLDVNATGTFLCLRSVLPGMLERGGGRAVVVASVAGLAGSRYTSAYTASKHAAVGLVRAAATETAGTGVTVNAVCPGYVRTDMTEESLARIAERTGRTREEAVAALERMSSLGRLLEPDEVASAVAYLASEEAGAVNGQALVLDGGGIQR
jgi:NAD(P)-dependent dehydrogenase (short-subunit alcohol dehydrogenase family)